MRMKKLEMLLAALMVVCVAIAAVQRLNSEEEAADAEQESITLIDVAYEDVTELSFIYGDREELTFIKDAGDWSYADDATFPLDGDYLDTQRLLIDKATFYEWLKSQTHYKIVEGKEDFYDREELSEAQ